MSGHSDIAKDASAWPDGVIARYLTVGGATVDLTGQIGYRNATHPTETAARCTACPAAKTFDWGWDAYHADFGKGPQPDFDEGGVYTTPRAREWAEAHAATCRAIPRPA